MDTEFFDDPINIVGSFNTQGDVNVQSLTWDGITYIIITVGRQWLDDEGRHVMAEAGDGTRFELLLRREDLVWRVKQVWRMRAVA